VRPAYGVNWRAFAALLLAGLLGVAAVLPYMMELVSTGIFIRRRKVKPIIVLGD